MVADGRAPKARRSGSSATAISPSTTSSSAAPAWLTATAPASASSGAACARSAAPFSTTKWDSLPATTPTRPLRSATAEFGQAPAADGPLHHLLYVGAIGKFSLTGSRFSGGYRGPSGEIRARDNFVAYNLLVDGPAGKASYELEFPNGGIAYVIGNVIGQSAGTDNPTLVACGAEGLRWPENASPRPQHPNQRLHHGNFGLRLG